MTLENKIQAAITDASFMIALCAKEPGRYTNAEAKLLQYANDGWQFYAAGVLVAEALYVLCRMLGDGQLTSEEHAVAVGSLKTYLSAMLPPPNGDAALIDTAEQIRSGCGCSHSADSLYLALAMELAPVGTVEILTFDAGQKRQAAANAPSVTVNLLT